MRMYLSVATLASLLLGAVAEMGRDEVTGGSDNLHSLSFYPATVRHTFGCVDSDIWANSCDIDLSMKTKDVAVAPTVFTPADWGESCDPWKGVTETGTLTYSEDDGVWKDADGVTQAGWSAKNGTWICPESQRSLSGCGDFRTDTREIVCAEDAQMDLFTCGRPGNGDRRTYHEAEMPHMAGPQRHVCIQHPIFFNNYAGADGSVVPPSLGRHRERWAKWGEYEFLPEARWMHNLEHGSIIFLYNPCLNKASLCAIRRFIQKWQQKLGEIEWENGGETLQDGFRFILTPFKDLATPMAMVAWGHIYASKCFNSADMDDFVQRYYRMGVEDWPPGGAYNYLWKDIAVTAEEEQCAPLPEADAPRLVKQLKVDAAKDKADLLEQIEALTSTVNDLSDTISNLKSECLSDSDIGDRRMLQESPCFAAKIPVTSGSHDARRGALSIIITCVMLLLNIV